MTKVLSIIGYIISIGNLPTTNINKALKKEPGMALFVYYYFYLIEG